MRGGCDRRLGQDLGELVVGRLHEVGVERAGDGQGDDLHGPELGGDRARPAARAAVSPETTMLPGPSRLAFQSRPRGATRRQSSSTAGSSRPRTLVMPLGVASGGGLHGLAAAADDLQARLEVQRPGEDQRRVFAQAQPGRALAGGDDVRVARLQALERRQAGDEDRRLADVGRLERLGRPLEAEPPQVEAQELAGPVEQRPDGGQLLVELAAHPDGCAPWPGNRKAILGMVGRSSGSLGDASRLGSTRRSMASAAPARRRRPAARRSGR